MLQDVLFSTLAQSSPAGGEVVPIPSQTGWVTMFLLLIVWLFVAAIVLGPLIHYFGLVRRSPQAFADDRRLH